MEKVLESLKILKMRVAEISDELSYQIEQLEEAVAVQNKGCLTKAKLVIYLTTEAKDTNLTCYWDREEMHPELVLRVDTQFDLKFVEATIKNRFVGWGIPEEKVEVEAVFHDLEDKEIRFIFGHTEIRDEKEVKYLVNNIWEICSEFDERRG